MIPRLLQSVVPTTTAILILLTTSYAVAAGSINGTVLNTETGEPVTGASVGANGGKTGSIANEKGEYLIKPLPDGTHEISTSMIGYERAVKIWQHRPSKREIRAAQTHTESDCAVMTTKSFSVSHR